MQGVEDSLLSLGRVAANNSARETIQVRESFMAHFSAEGAVPWQPTEKFLFIISCAVYVLYV